MKSHLQLIFLLLSFTPACDKEQIEQTCESAAIRKCGTAKSLIASACRGGVMSVCVKKLCNLPFNNCNVATSDPLCATPDECDEPDDGTYPDDSTWDYCGTDGSFYECDDQTCTPAGDTCPA